MATEILTEQFLTVTVKGFKDGRGKPVGVDGVPQWATDNSDVLTLEPSEDGMSCKVTSGLMPGVATLRLVADADLGEGVSELVGTVEFDVKARMAVSVELEVGTAEDLPL